MRVLRNVVFLLWSTATCTHGGQPAVQSPVVDRLLTDARYEWVTIDSSRARIHFPVGSYADANRDSLTARVEASTRIVLSRLDAADDAGTFDLFFVDSRNDMEQLTGSPVTGFSYYRANAVVLVVNSRWRPFERHELAHVVTLQTWGRPAGVASVEGIATFVDGECGGYENGRVARTMLEKGDLLEVQTLVEEFRAQDDLVAYLQAAALFEFMYDQLGTAILHSLWTEGLQIGPSLLGVTEGEFEQQFQEWLSSKHSRIPEAAWRKIRSDGCGITAGSAG